MRQLAFRIAACCCLLGTLVRVPAAQTQRPLSLDHFSTADGLAHNYVAGLAQDERGFLWVGSRDGLQRFDGRVFENITLPPHLQPPRTAEVRPVGFDHRGKLLLVIDRSLFAFDPQTSTCERMHAPFGLPSDAVAAAGNFTAIISDGKLIRYGETADDAEPFVFPDSLRATAVSATKAGVVTVAARTDFRQYILRIDSTGSSAVVAVDVALGDVRWMVARSDDSVWIATNSEIARVDMEAMRTHRVDIAPGYAITSLTGGDSGPLWAGTTDRLLEIRPSDGFVTERIPEALHHPPLIGGALVGRDGELWISSLARGLFRAQPDGPTFRHIGRGGGTAIPLKSNFIMAVHESADGSLWTGSLGGGLSRLSPSLDSVMAIDGPDVVATVSGMTVWAIFEDSRQRIWFSSDQTLCRLDKQARRLERCLDTPTSGAIGVIGEDFNGHILAPTFSGRLLVVDPVTMQLLREERVPTSIVVMRRDDHGGMWLGSIGAGIHFLPFGGRESIPIDSLLGYETGIARHSVFDIRSDDEGGLYLATTRGLEWLPPARDSLHVYPAPGGRATSTVFSIAPPDTSRYLWLGTGHGLVQFDRRSRAMRLYTMHDGTGISEFNRRAALRRQSGTLLFGGAEGLTEFDPARFSQSPPPPRVVVSWMEIAGREGMRKQFLHRSDEVRLGTDEYALSFVFTSPLARHQSRIRYRYRIDGIDHAWQEVGAERRARYAHIPPGRYTFRVQSGIDGVWNPEPATVSLHVPPPIYARWWFRFLVLAAVAAVLTAAYRYRVQRLLELQRLRLRIAEDLHDDIGSGLSSIALLSDVIQKNSRVDQGARTKLDLIGTSARQMVSELRDIVWTVDPDQDNVLDLVARMRDTASALLPQVRCEFDVPDHLPRHLRMETRRELFFIYKEALHNVARHANATKVYIRLDVRGDFLELTVHDDGVGFDAVNGATGGQRKNGTGIGMKSLRQRVQRLGGSLEVGSLPGKGTRIHATARMT